MSRKDPMIRFMAEKAKNHKKFFIEKTEKPPKKLSSCALLSFGIGLFFFFLAIIYDDLQTKYITMNAGAILMILTLGILFCYRERNLKGVPLDPRTDLVRLVTYNVDEVLGDNLCMISVADPDVTAFSCVVESWPIKQMANRNGLEFDDKLVFELSEYRLFTFFEGTKRPGGPIDPIEGFG